MPLYPERHRLPGGCRIYGGFPRADAGISGGRHAVSGAIEATYGGDRTLYPPPRHPFADQSAGTLEETLFFLGLIRLLLPKVLLPATTALGTIAPDGREQGILAGANVIMPNLSPPDVRESYALYDNKLCTGAEAAEAEKSWKNGCRHWIQVITTRGGTPLM